MRCALASLRVALVRPNRALVLVVIGVVTMLTLSLAWPVASRLFQFGPLHWDDLQVVAAIGGGVVAMLELAKRIGRRGVQDRATGVDNRTII